MIAVIVTALVFVGGIVLIVVRTTASSSCAPKFSLAKLSEYSSRESLYVSVHGHVFDFTTARNNHSGGAELINEYGGKDATWEFPRKPNLCGLQVDPTVDYLNKTSFAHGEASVAILTQKNTKLWRGYVSYTAREISDRHGNANSWFVIINGRIYDFTLFRQYNQKYLGDAVSAMVIQFGGRDASEAFNKLDQKQRDSALPCMDLIHFAGVLDDYCAK